MLSEFGVRVSRKRLPKKVRKRNKILKIFFNTTTERCAFVWLSLKEIGALCNKGGKIQENESDLPIDLKPFIFANSSFLQQQLFIFSLN
jgi:hypothetical protein